VVLKRQELVMITDTEMRGMEVSGSFLSSFASLTGTLVFMTCQSC
jgi:hypothetical protein